MLTLILIGFVVFFIGIGFLRKKSKKQNETKNIAKDISNNNTDAYTLYSDWCKKKNEFPILKEEFENLANAHGSISLADVMDKHRIINSYQKVEDDNESNNNYVSELEDKLQKEKDEQKKRDEKFVTSAIAGYITNSTTTGTLLGGNLLGGMFGDYLNKKPKK